MWECFWFQEFCVYASDSVSFRFIITSVYDFLLGVYKHEQKKSQEHFSVFLSRIFFLNYFWLSCNSFKALYLRW